MSLPDDDEKWRARLELLRITGYVLGIFALMMVFRRLTAQG